MPKDQRIRRSAILHQLWGTRTPSLLWRLQSRDRTEGKSEGKQRKEKEITRGDALEKANDQQLSEQHGEARTAVLTGSRGGSRSEPVAKATSEWASLEKNARDCSIQICSAS